MKIVYKFSLYQDWVKDNLKFTECTYSQKNLDMNQVLNILDDFENFTAGFGPSKKNVVCWLVQNERMLLKCGEGCVDYRTLVIDADLAYNMLDSYRDVANKYGVGFDDDIYYGLRAEIEVHEVTED